MMTPEEVLLVMEFENEILELIETKDDYTQSDLQGRAMAIVMNILAAGRKSA